MTEYKIPSVKTTVKAELPSHFINIAIKKAHKAAGIVSFNICYQKQIKYK